MRPSLQRIMRMNKISRALALQFVSLNLLRFCLFTAPTCSSFYVSWSTSKGLISGHHPNCAAGQCILVCNDNCATFISYLAWSSLGDLVSRAFITIYYKARTSYRMQEVAASALFAT
jgi:hypothetical protein